MDGQYGSLAFVATHADVVNRSELIRNLNLPASTSLVDGIYSFSLFSTLFQLLKKKHIIIIVL